jgi:hypothetical protein
MCSSRNPHASACEMVNRLWLSWKSAASTSG